ncbi:MAG: sugar kinase [Rhodobacteraceae bacterium]|nr:sugar kinase [Paracoccaceae bacterium]
MGNGFDLICLGEPLVEFNQQPGGMFRIGIGGDVSNAAISAVRYGIKAGFISKVGADIFGSEIINKWKFEGVDYTNVEISPDEETGIYFVTHDESGHKFSYRRSNSAASNYPRSNLPQSEISKSKVFYASGINLAISELMKEATLEAMKIARDGLTSVAFDPNLRPALWPIEIAREVIHETMRYCDIALPSLEDAQHLTGLISPEEICGFYHDLGPKTVVLTLGKNGVYLSEEGNETQLPGHQVEAVDATGAGDCFNGAFLATWIQTGCFKRAAKKANFAAAQSTTHYGALR